MDYIKNVKQSGVVRFLVNENINLDEFRSIMRELASTLGSKVEWITMPEAEVGKIKLSTGEIYAKLDFEYGLELDCEGFMDQDISKIETTLSEK